jgi:hypothetical protein
MLADKFIVLLLLLLIASSTAAQKLVTENIYSLGDSAKSPAASLNDVSWIAGHWKGEALGGVVEEIWSTPLGNSMMCAFKLVVDNKVKFYELEVIYEETGTLILKLKHFHGDLKGWEEKDETVDFPLVKIVENKAYFDGLTFERIGNYKMNVYVLFDKDGSYTEMKFSYTK